MNIIVNLFESSLGKKYIMAVSGSALFLFVVAHLFDDCGKTGQLLLEAGDNVIPRLVGRSIALLVVSYAAAFRLDFEQGAECDARGGAALRSAHRQTPSLGLGIPAWAMDVPRRHAG